jgi:hypothetical protein
MAAGAVKYIVQDLYWQKGTDSAGFSYPLPGIQSEIHNAALLASALLSRMYSHTGDRQLLDRALRAARYAVSRQNSDGSWFYGERPSQRWIDNFHTGYNLCALQSISRYANTRQFESSISNGLVFYRRHFFRSDGGVRYFYNRDYPIDSHCIAQSILTLLALKDRDERNLPTALSVFYWAMEHMCGDDSTFYYQRHSHYTIRTPYMRWSQLWMLLAISALLKEAFCAESPGVRDSVVV